MSKPPLTADDLSRFRWIDHVRLSPTGDRVAYEVTWADPEVRQNRGRIVVQATGAGGAARELRADVRRDRAPEWSPDGDRIAFLSRVRARDQLFVAPVDGGEAIQLTAIPDGVAAVEWSPDGRTLAFLARVLSDPDGVVDDPRPAESDDQPRRPPVARVARRLDYKHDGAGYQDGRYSHLFVVPAGGGEPCQLTGGAWSVGEFSWAPDGRALAVVGDAEPDADLRRTNRLYRVDLHGDRRTLAEGLQMASPAWSPRGDLVAFAAPTAEDGGRHQRLWVVPADPPGRPRAAGDGRSARDGGRPRCLTLELDRAVGGWVVTDMRADHSARLRWSPAGDRLYFQASGPGVAEVLSADLEGRVTVEVPARRRAVYDFDVEAGRIAACVADAATPGDVVLVHGGAERALTDANPWLRDRYVAQPRRHLFTAADGLEIEGWLLEPPGFDPTRRYPLILQIHGGPHSQYGWAFFHELQMLAGMGFLVLYTNPRGSDGYGEAFRRACVRDWGGRDYEDLMTALDQLIERTGCVDEGRLGVAGGSYGGYMTSWTVGHTNRFAAAAVRCPVIDWLSFAGQTDIPFFTYNFFDAPFWEKPEQWLKQSPLMYVGNVTTPTVVMTGVLDMRTPMPQSEEYYEALKMRGIPSALIRFEGEYHGTGSKPSNFMRTQLYMMSWYNRWKRSGTAVTAAME